MSSTAISCLRYRDAPAMIDWLGQAFGLEPRLIVDDGAGGIAHAQLTRGPGMIMLGSARDDDFCKLQATPADLGGTSQSVYLVVSDPDALYEKAQAAGAEIVRPITDEDYGGRGFSCRDPEGHLWNLGSYNPWAG